MSLLHTPIDKYLGKTMNDFLIEKLCTLAEKVYAILYGKDFMVDKKIVLHLNNLSMYHNSYQYQLLDHQGNVIRRFCFSNANDRIITETIGYQSNGIETVIVFTTSIDAFLRNEIFDLEKALKNYEK